ncbi:endonuclease VII domain-containing protein [Kitasatospora sp. NBC_00240]|uniref:endonuclease domain-containing protein n=1 Tax=Kitasatospora sp. NBC_00240 TaxID=2903567 RepID=UPI0022506BA8|nr:endonuclease domain-containing protein [Kitasatospora sp. NBC_00240]MCX5209727.1 endonuclease VII domain-containing protein [Kitasatospora sp. NBC_00240]
MMADSASPTRSTETRHHPLGKTCHHFQYHGLSCDEFDELHVRAGGHCEICGIASKETGGRRLVVDHTWGEDGRIVRGLLCDKCNVVMACMDGRKPWGKNRRWERRAREYAMNAWGIPRGHMVRSP